MNRKSLVASIRQKQSFLCVGLDPDMEKIPEHLRGAEDPIFEFNKGIIDATRPFAVAYKPNIAFYESRGVKGWESLEKTVKYIGRDHFTIADAKRGDIGNTSRMYAKAFFENMPFDAVTVAPYMGADSVEPFLEFEGKWAILLALTSNIGASDFQLDPHTDTREKLYERVLKVASGWGSEQNLMFVVGATRPEYLKKIRALAPHHFLLVPGVGAQGGSLEDVAKYGLNKDVGLLVNSSRGIIYASSGKDFAEAAGDAASEIAANMKSILSRNH